MGSYPAVSLAEARKRALTNKKAVEEGRNPRARTAPIFRQAAETAIELRIPTWRNGGKSATQWRASLERYVYPELGDKSVAEIDTVDVLRVLIPHWNRRAKTMRRVKQRFGAVLAWAVAAGYRTDNPARGPVNHLCSTPHQRAAAPKGTASQQSGRSPSGGRWLWCLPTDHLGNLVSHPHSDQKRRSQTGTLTRDRPRAEGLDSAGLPH